MIISTYPILEDRATTMRQTCPGYIQDFKLECETQPSCSLCSLCCTFLKSGRLLCRLQLNGCHVILRVYTVAVHFLLCVYLPLADVDGCLASAWLGCHIFVRYLLERQSGRNKISVCSLSKSPESCNRHMR